MDTDIPPEGSRTAQGLKVYYSPETALVDIIAVPGFAVNPEKSWTWSESASIHSGNATGFNWLSDQDGLQKDFPQARIMLYQYNSQYKGPDSVDSPLEIIACEFLSALKSHRKTCPERPMICIAHSMGGLLLAQAVVTSCNNPQEYRGLFECFAGCIFFGTPFEGTDIAKLATIYASTAKFLGNKWYTSLLHFMDPSNQALAELRHQFRRAETLLSPKINLYCVFEKQPTDFGRFVKVDWIASVVRDIADKYIPSDLQYFVSQTSSIIDGVQRHGLPRSHCDLVRFQGPNDDCYRHVLLPKLEEFFNVARSDVRKRISSAKPVDNTYFDVPLTLVLSFKGRGKVLERIKSAFSQSGQSNRSRPPIVVLQAMGGQGKSQTALQFCNQVQDEYRGIFWIDATSQDILERSFTKLAEQLDQARAASLTDAKAKARLVVDTLSLWNQAWLLVFDNYDQPDAFYIKPYLPTRGHGAIIITSRHEKSHSYAHPGAKNVICLGSMEDDGALDLLEYHLGEAENDCESRARSNLVTRLGGLALAIDQAAAYIKYHKLSIRSFLERYKNERKRILQYYRTETWEYNKHLTDSEKETALTAYTTWELSFDQIHPESRIKKEWTAEFLNVLAFLQPSRISEVIFHQWYESGKHPYAWSSLFVGYDLEENSSDTEDSPQGNASDTDSRPQWSHELFWAVIRDLEQLSLITSTAKTPSNDSVHFGIHPVIRDWLYIRMESSLRKRAAQMSISIFGASLSTYFWRTIDVTTVQEMQGHLDLLTVTWSLSRMEDESAYRALTMQVLHFAHFYRRTGQTFKSVKLLEKVEGLSKTTFLESEPWLLSLKSELARAYLEYGKTLEAVELLEHVVRVREPTILETHPDRLASQRVLASAYLEYGKTKEAIELLEHVVQVQETTLLKTHSDRLASQHVLARVYLEYSKAKEAIELLEHVVQVQETTLLKNHPDRLYSQHELARAYLEYGKAKEAIELLEHVVRVRETTLLETHPDQLASQHELARAYLEYGKAKEAIELLEHVVRVRETTLLETHPDQLASQHELARAYLEYGKTKEAIELLEHVVRVRETTLLETHPDRLTSQHELARAYLTHGRSHEAVQLFEVVVRNERRNTDLAEFNPDCLKSSYMLAEAHIACGSVTEGIRCLEHLIEVAEAGLVADESLSVGINKVLGLARELLESARQREESTPSLNQCQRDNEAPPRGE